MIKIIYLIFYNISKYGMALFKALYYNIPQMLYKIVINSINGFMCCKSNLNYYKIYINPILSYIDFYMA